MAPGLIVRLADGSEIGPLDRDDLRSWYERGLVSTDSLVKRPDATRWTTLGQEVDVSLWRSPSGGGRSGGRSSPSSVAGRAGGVSGGSASRGSTSLSGASSRSGASAPRSGAAGRPVGPRVASASSPGSDVSDLFTRLRSLASLDLPAWAKWTGLAVVLVAVLAAGFAYLTSETPAQKRLRASAAADRRFADAEAGVALDLPPGWIILRPDTDAVAAPPSARLLLAEPATMTVGFLVSESSARPYSSADAFLERLVQDRQKSQARYDVKSRSDAQVGPFPARVAVASWKAGEEAFREHVAVWKEAWTYFGLVTWTPQAQEARGLRAVEALGRGFASVGQLGQRVQQALQRVIADVPHLSPRAAEALMGQSAAGVLEPPEVFRRSWDLASRGLFGLNRTEARELSSLTSALYARVPGRDRSRLSAYVARVRARETTRAAEDQEMCGVMRGAVEKLSARQRERLQALFDKALAAGLSRS